MDTSTSMVIGFDHSMEDHREENATQALSDWNQLNELNAAFRNVLERLDDVLSDQIRHISAIKRRNILEVVRGSLQCAVIKVNENLGLGAPANEASILDELQMTQTELREFLPTVSGHSSTLCEIAASLGCEIGEVSEMVKSKCDIISELQEDLAAAKLHEINQNNKIVDLENQLRQLQDQVARISTAQLAGNSSATAHGSGGFERLPRHERWATAGMDRAIPSIVASILTTVFPKHDEW
ncbi:hypothetical protein COOONC_10622 [Cooperia oncophora]